MRVPKIGFRIIESMCSHNIEMWLKKMMSDSFFSILLGFVNHLDVDLLVDCFCEYVRALPTTDRRWNLTTK